MNKKKVILGSVGVLACLVGGSLFAVNQFVDRKMILNQLYSNIEKQTGRKLALQNLDIHFFPWPEINASNITLSNMPGGKNPHFITAGNLKANLNLWSLWQRTIHFKSIQLSNVQIHLERNAQGQKNWDLQPVEAIKDNNLPTAQHITHRKWGWQFNNVQLKNVECWYDDALNHKNTHLFFEQAELNQLETDKVRFNINGSHHHAKFTITGRISHLTELLEGDDTVAPPAKFQVNLSEYVRNQNVGNIRISGTLKSLVKAKGYDIIVRGTILNLDDLNHLFPHVHLPSIENITLSTAFKDISKESDPQGLPQIDLLQLHTGKINAAIFPNNLQLMSTEIVANDLNADVNTQIVGQLYGKMFRWSGNLGRLKTLQDNVLFKTDENLPISGKLSSADYNLKLDGTIGGKNPSLATELSLLNYNNYVKDFGSLNAQNILYSGKLIVSFPLTLVSLERINTDFLYQNITSKGKITSNSVKINQYNFDNFSSNLEWKNRELSFTQLQLANKQSDIKGDVHYSLQQETPELNVRIFYSSFPMKWIEDYFSIANIYTGQMTALGNLSTKGNNWQEWQKNLTGQLGLFGTDGKLEAEGLRHYIGQAAATLPLKKSLSTQCIALRTQINSDDLYFDTITLQTNQFALNGQGTFDIPDQKLNLHFIPDVRLGAISASAPIRIGGTLAKPYTTFDMNKNRVFSLNINALNKSQPATNYCQDAIEKAKKPLGILQKK
ncbi:AsmA family protein [Commensalibacter nepenthis]|uniref:AsmA family protein n=1 Tax=Commensalibacter nepenthis TaxID=3043872 RepID=A0ABT6QA13_9PROT|nr:AsmA family protein [Commensalibacter sp. TBRC 10068]MDI2113755.1 AsmA family protein [Commensalibacter sp. TBRC 10068]